MSVCESSSERTSFLAKRGFGSSYSCLTSSVIFSSFHVPHRLLHVTDINRKDTVIFVRIEFSISLLDPIKK